MARIPALKLNRPHVLWASAAGAVRGRVHSVSPTDSTVSPEPLLLQSASYGKQGMIVTQSMTGFARGSVTTGAISVTVECRSVNNRFLDLHFRMPDVLRRH
jgi:hypothetical protein